MSCAKKLVNHFGGRREAAEAMSVTTETIRLWLRDGIPLEKALHVEESSAGIVSAEQVLAEARRQKATVSP